MLLNAGAVKFYQLDLYFENMSNYSEDMMTHQNWDIDIWSFRR